MMERRASACEYDYVLPARTLRGSTGDVLAEIDEAVEGLLALRRLVAVRHVSRPSGVAHRWWAPVAAVRKRPDDQ